jgi:hypothetical protein
LTTIASPTSAPPTAVVTGAGSRDELGQAIAAVILHAIADLLPQPGSWMSARTVVWRASWHLL